jgi:phage gp45-like
MDNDSVLPSGLFDTDFGDRLSGFNRTYNNSGLKVGVVVKSHEIAADTNVGKLCVEYDVVVVEQDENRGITPMRYRNCISADGLGAIADFLEFRIREQKSFEGPAEGLDVGNQDGAVALLLCLDKNSDKGVIVGFLSHPDRKSKLTEGRQLAGEFNGVGIEIRDDGSVSLTWRGSTDNKGEKDNEDQEPASVDIEVDGSIQVANKGVTIRAEAEGNVSVAAAAKISLDAKEDISAKTETNIDLEAKENFSAKMKALLIQASGSATLESEAFKISTQKSLEAKAQQIKAEAQVGLVLKAPQIEIDATLATIKGLVFLGGQGGTPAPVLSTQYIGIGNMGAPVVSQAVGPFSSKVFVAS